MRNRRLCLITAQIYKCLFHDNLNFIIKFLKSVGQLFRKDLCFHMFQCYIFKIEAFSYSFVIIISCICVAEFFGILKKKII